MSGAQFTALAGVAATPRGDSRRRLTGLVWTAVAVTILSGWLVVTRFSVTRELGIWDTAALRFGIGVLLLAPVLLRRRTSLPPKVRTWEKASVGTVFNVSLPSAGAIHEKELPVGKHPLQLRHDASNFDTRTQDKVIGEQA